MMAATVNTARAMRFQVHLNFWLSSVTQLCPLGTGTEVPEMLGACGCSLFSFTIGLRFSCFLPGDVCNAGFPSKKLQNPQQAAFLLLLGLECSITGVVRVCCMSSLNLELHLACYEHVRRGSCCLPLSFTTSVDWFLP